MLLFPSRSVAAVFLVAPLLTTLACSSSGGEASDASIDETSSPEASPSTDASRCDSDAAIPECLRGAPCSCDDHASHNAPAVCVGGAWACPAGYTRFEDCRGVPPGPSCDAGPVSDAAGADQ